MWRSSHGVGDGRGPPAKAPSLVLTCFPCQGEHNLPSVLWAASWPGRALLGVLTRAPKKTPPMNSLYSLGPLVAHFFVTFKSNLNHKTLYNRLINTFLS